MGSRYGRVARSMMASGKTIMRMALALCFMLMAIYMKDNGSMIWLMDMECSNEKTVTHMLATGLKTSNMEKELRPVYVVLDMKEISTKVENKVTAYLYLMTKVLT